MFKGIQITSLYAAITAMMLVPATGLADATFVNRQSKVVKTSAGELRFHQGTSKIPSKFMQHARTFRIYVANDHTYKCDDAGDLRDSFNIVEGETLTTICTNDGFLALYSDEIKERLCTFRWRQHGCCGKIRHIACDPLGQAKPVA